MTKQDQDKIDVYSNTDISVDDIDDGGKRDSDQDRQSFDSGDTQEKREIDKSEVCDGGKRPFNRMYMVIDDAGILEESSMNDKKIH